jgi:DNA-binding NarL/FixJ family response regulator
VLAASRPSPGADAAAVVPEGAFALPRAAAAELGSSLAVLIVSDVCFLREGLSDILLRQSEIAVVATAENPDQALASILADRPDAVLLDANLQDGLAVAARIVGGAAGIPVIALAMAEIDHAVIAWAEAGIAGYVPRSASIADLIDAVLRAVRGEQACSAKVAGAMLRRLHQLALEARQERYASIDVRLTPREREIAELLAEGFSNKLIARRLHIAVSTAKCHVHNLLDKLKLQRRTDIARWLRQ